MIDYGGVGWMKSSLSLGLYNFNNEIWKTGWIFICEGKSSLYATDEITSRIEKRSIYLGVSFLLGCYLSTRSIILWVESKTWSLILNSW